MHPPPLQFDYSKGQVFIQNGVIFYSPNCSRSILVPKWEKRTVPPFESTHLDVGMFKQPVWWSDPNGWLSFIPLSPSYISAPFAPFCWMPRIEAVNILKPGQDGAEKRFRMVFDDAFVWKKHEELIVGAVEKIRIWHKICGSLPPKPSFFQYDAPHKSLSISKKIITLARDWFTIWMGTLSYLIAQTKRLPANRGIYGDLETSPMEHSKEASPFPLWHQQLLKKHGYSDHWLDNLTTSTVCSFNIQTARAGVIFQWTLEDDTRPSIEWFNDHNIPMFFVWSSVEEQAILHDHSLAYLQPPTEMLQDALTLLFRTPDSDLPLAGLILRRYYQLLNDPITGKTIEFLRLKHSPSFVFKYLSNEFLSQTDALQEIEGAGNAEKRLEELLDSRERELRDAATKAASLPFQSILEVDEVEEVGILHNHWKDFLERRDKRQAEMIETESKVNKQRRESRLRKPVVANATIYTWETIHSSGGKPVYMRVRVNKKRNEDVFSMYRTRHKIYNAMCNEWDLCREFDSGKSDAEAEPDGDDSASDDNDSDPYILSCVPLQVEEDLIGMSVVIEPENSIKKENPGSASQERTDDMSVDDHDEHEERPFPRDLLEMLHLCYGFVSPLPGAIVAKTTYDWNSILMSLGFVKDLFKLDVTLLERDAIGLFFSGLMGPVSSTISEDLYDLNDTNRAALIGLFDFPAIHRPFPDLFVFSAPRSEACDWLLGVHSPAAALYICRIINSNPYKHTIVTVAHHLLERGVAFRTLLGLSYSPRLVLPVTVSKPFQPTSFRFVGYKFTVDDFEAAMHQTQALLSLSQGRAAILKGGILGRIAREYLSTDSALHGPSIEVTKHRSGYFTSALSTAYLYADDELTASEMATICGTYHLLNAQIGQECVKSWFPPHQVWIAHQHGSNWLEWTERNELFYQKLLSDIREGKAQPRTAAQWRKDLKGQKVNRILVKNNLERAEIFLDKVLSVQGNISR